MLSGPLGSFLPLESQLGSAGATASPPLGATQEGRDCSRPTPHRRRAYCPARPMPRRWQPLLALPSGIAASLQDGHKLLAGDSFLLVEVLGKLVELVTVVGQDLSGLLVLGFYQLHHLLVDSGRGLGGAGKGGVAPPGTGSAPSPGPPCRSCRSCRSG